MREEPTLKEDVPKDISKRTIAILLVIAIILSVTSTLIAVARTPQAEEVTEDITSTHVSVRVVEPPKTEKAQVIVNVA